MRGSLAVASFSLLLVAGCGGDGDGGGPKTYRGGSHSVEGRCDDDDAYETHRVRPDDAGTLHVTLTWSEPAADLDLTIWALPGGDLELIGDDWDGDSPAEVSVAVAGDVLHEVDVECYGDSDGVPFDLDLIVP